MRQAWVAELNEYLMSHRDRDGADSPRRYVAPAPIVVCDDGFTMSVQAAWGVYCTPRTDIGPWSAVEVGFLSSIEPLLWDYAEQPGNWTQTVYPYVPIEVVGAVIELHGGSTMLSGGE